MGLYLIIREITTLLRGLGSIDQAAEVIRAC